MRYALAALPLLISLGASPVRAEITPEQCAELATAVSKAAGNVDNLRRSIEGLRVRTVMSSGSKPLVEAGGKLDAAREVAVPAIKAYVAALQDLNYQLNICSR